MKTSTTRRCGQDHAAPSPPPAAASGAERPPYCPTALLPYCPTALLPYCPQSRAVPKTLSQKIDVTPKLAVSSIWWCTAWRRLSV
ncbi:hypothetical protein EB815_17040 [Mesorhizobium loti]|nr:hypothetical protein EB815_17040 [Mesorhizobium loti]